MKGFLALIFLLLICVDFTKSASCVASANKLTVNYGTSCDLISSLTGLDEVSISGTVYVKGSPGSTPPSLEATNIYVYATGRILADGYGYGPMDGPGKGSSGGSGGSYGGRGGMKTGIYLKSNEAVAYGGIEKPSDFGSGGGCSTGGKGGGVITLKATDDVRVDGLVSANGNADGSNCGGGSGGSIYIDTDYFKGSGMVTARGGTGSGTGGGGGGGRISIVHRVSATFSGDIFADGGECSTDVNQLTLQSTTASSARHAAASYGDMTKSSTISWRAYYFNTDQWLQASLSSPKWITRVATRGHQSYNMWIKTFKIQYYNDTSSAWV
ncbi:uncharacterized transmembrane protein DDB_G0289901-like [Mytilus californianus]|uniref:uncharacterized transmembrane protein DDB_G0289901-like n=1 Tax=Mytilus californianus TaxID=6549 RepID=UPI002247421E|nr:uncharacterized transmembrane protein DDB_G0289901-like [Mytilus californianus]